MYTPLRAKSALVLVSSIFAGVLLYSLPVSAATTNTLLPTGDGAYVQWTPSTGTTHFSLVNETACNGTTNYNRTTTTSNRDSYTTTISSVPNGATITQINIGPCASRDGTGAGTSVLNVFYRLNGTNSADAGAYSITSGNIPTALATTSFSGLSIVKSSTTTLEIGGVYTSGTKGLRLSRIAATITYTPMTPPSSLTATATTSSAVNLQWTYATTSAVEGFTIERSLSTSSFVTIATTTNASTSYYDSGLTPGTAYYYRTRAFTYAGYSTYSNSVWATTTPNPPTTPSGLFTFATTTATTTNIVMFWSDTSSNETAFSIERDSGSGFTQYASTTANNPFYTDYGPLTSGTTYIYRVRSYNTGGYSGYSNTSTTTLP